MVRPTRLSTALIIAAPLLSAATPANPSVDEILDHFVSALGGKVALEKVTSRFMAGTLQIPGMKTPATTAEYFQSPNLFAAVTDVPDYGTIRTVYDGKAAWQSDPQRGVTEVTGAPELADLSRRADIHWHLKLHELYPGLAVKGHEKIAGKEAWKLEATVESWDYAFYFDRDSGLLVRFDTDRHAEGGALRVLMSDYRPVNGILFAYSTSMSGAGPGWNRTLTSVRLNVSIDDSIFAKPAATTP